MDFFSQTTPFLSLLTERCGSGMCLAQLEAQFYAMCAQLGFAHARFSVISDRMTSASTLRNQGAPANQGTQANQSTQATHSAQASHAATQTDTLLFSINFDSFPAGFVTQYVNGQYWRVDALLHLVQKNMHSTFFTCWHDAEQTSGAKHQDHGICALAKSFDINSGALLSYWNGSRQLVISVGSNEAANALQQRLQTQLLQQKILSLALLLNAVIEKISLCQGCVIQARKPRVASFSLTRMQKAILLDYLHDSNASLSSISEAQGISSETVKYHLKCIREKLDMPGASGHVLAHKARHASLL